MFVNRACPLCGSCDRREYTKFKVYSDCLGCGLVYQATPPDKTFQVPIEEGGMVANHEMSDRDKQVNRNIAQSWYSKLKPRRVLDIGCAYPYMLSCYKEFGCEVLGIDGVPEVVDNGEKLGVETKQVDFEKLDPQELGVFDFVQLIHVIEHFYELRPTIQKIKQLMTDDGYLYLRTPDTSVVGIERDLTDMHAKIHPHLFNYSSFRKMCELEGLYMVWYGPMHGAGQSDVLLTKRRPTVSLAMIVKNEEQVLARCLNSIETMIDDIVIVDTGSTDRTIEIARIYTNDVHSFEWCDDFSKARNFALSKCKGDWVIWADADDIFENAKEIDGMIGVPEIDAWDFEILYGEDRFNHARMFRNRWGVEFRGAIHEYPVLDGLRKAKSNIRVRHTTDKVRGESQIDRNMRILTKEHESNPTDTRTMFYLGNALREADKTQEALGMYQKYLSTGGWQEERFMARLYRLRLLSSQGNHREAIDEGFRALAEDDRWAEAYCEIGVCYYRLGNYKACVLWNDLASSIEVPNTALFKNMRFYRGLPLEWSSRACEAMGDYEKALDYMVKAGEKEPENDYYKNRIGELLKKATTIVCHRPGAMGDVLLCTPALKALKEKFPHKKIAFHTSHPEILKGNPYVDEVLENLPEDKLGGHICFRYPMHEGYPDVPMRKHLAHHFADCAGVTLDPSPYPVLPRATGVEGLPKGVRVCFSTRTGWSKYKEWHDDRWQGLIDRFPDVSWIQLGGEDEPEFRGVTRLAGKLSVSESVYVLSVCEAFVGLDSFLHHAAAGWKHLRSVILWGSTHPAGSGYGWNINLCKGLDCQPCYRETHPNSVHPKSPCPIDKQCLDITVDEVATALSEIIV